ncbi:MAG: hypothetical protein QM642_07995 [Edaphocola sp.]
MEANTDDGLLQVLDSSACLGKSQLTRYLKKDLYPEELRAVELHLSSCALCSDAVDGLEANSDNDALLASLTMPTLPQLPPKEKTKPKETPTIPAPTPKPTIKSTPPKRFNLGKPVGIAAAMALIIGAGYWLYKNGSTSNPSASEDVSTGKVAEGNEPHDSPTVASSKAMDTALLLAEKKKLDYTVSAQRIEANRKKKRDSLQALAALRQADTNKPVAVASAPAEATSDRKAVADAEKNEATKAKQAITDLNEMTDFDKGMVQYRRGNYAEALELFKRPEKDDSDPKHWDAVFYTALSNKFLDKKRRARKGFEKIVEANAPYTRAAQKQLAEMKNED